jgi:hypothetical protein
MLSLLKVHIAIIFSWPTFSSLLNGISVCTGIYVHVWKINLRTVATHGHSTSLYYYIGVGRTSYNAFGEGESI